MIDRETLEYWKASVRSGQAALLEALDAFNAQQAEIETLRETVDLLSRIIEELVRE